MGKKINLEGQRFGRLTVIKDTKKRAHRGHIIWLCHCDCGNLTESRGDNLRNGLIQSCGCLHDELFEINRIKYRYKHGDASNGKTKFYRFWRRIKARCYNSNDKDYKYYGAKGIKIYPEWKNDYLAFKKWALANGYKPGLILDRIKSNGNYEPSNCQWVTNSENSSKTAKFRIGDKSPRWLGGISFEPYGIEFNKKLKYEIRKRDKFTCQFPNCGIKENGKAHDCHHVNYIKKDNRPNNFTTLCVSCHPKTNTNREYWENYFKYKVTS